MKEKTFICEKLGEWSDELYNAGINMICNKDMLIEISEKDMEKIKKEFPAAYEDIIIVSQKKII